MQKIPPEQRDVNHANLVRAAVQRRPTCRGSPEPIFVICDDLGYLIVYLVRPRGADGSPDRFSKDGQGFGTNWIIFVREGFKDYVDR